MCRLNAFLKGDYNLSAGILTDRMRCNALDFLNSCVNYSSFIGVHRIKNHVFAVFKYLLCTSVSKSTKIVVSLFSVISDVYGNLTVLVIVNSLVYGKTEKILNRIKSLATSADYNAVIFTAVMVGSEGISNMTSVSRPSITARRPRAPVLRSMAKVEVSLSDKREE